LLSCHSRFEPDEWGRGRKCNWERQDRRDLAPALVALLEFFHFVGMDVGALRPRHLCSRSRLVSMAMAESASCVYHMSHAEPSLAHCQKPSTRVVHFIPRSVNTFGFSSPAANT
jgi:hypothetical protein